MKMHQSFPFLLQVLKTYVDDEAVADWRKLLVRPASPLIANF